MLTRCPNCETTFRVTPEQLKARQGRVRCGACQEVFNALDTLIETTSSPAAAAETTETAPPEPAVEEPEVAAEAEVPEANPDAELAAPPTEEATADESSTAEAIAETLAEPEPTPEPVPVEPIPEPVPEARPEASVAAKPSKWPWAFGSLAMLLVLAAQAVMHFRTEIAVLYPATGPTLASACEAFGCKLLLPRKAELASIEASDLHPNGDGKLVLTATLKNRAPFAQEYPHLELTLTDTADKALLRRVLAAADYLPKTTEAAGFGAGKEVSVELSIDAPGVPAAGYRLYLFYP